MTYISSSEMHTSQVKNHATHGEQDNTANVRKKQVGLFEAQKKIPENSGIQYLFFQIIWFCSSSEDASQTSDGIYQHGQQYLPT
jgi:hypothetical protein